MSRDPKDAPVYDVSCPRCNVTFPVGTKRCIHCGGPTGQLAEPPGSLREMLARRAELEEEAEVKGPRSALSRGVAAVWVLLAVAISIYRACTQAG
jgi:hypothetical protein